MSDLYKVINRKTEEHFAEGFRFYDEGIAAFNVGLPFNPRASLSWRDGYKDARDFAHELWSVTDDKGTE